MPEDRIDIWFPPETSPHWGWIMLALIAGSFTMTAILIRALV